jgi:hypothetical protein
VLPKLNDRQYLLRPQQHLTVTLDRATIRRLAVRDGRISMLLTGDASALKAGPHNWERKLLPSKLEIYYADDFIKQFVTILVGAFAIAFKVIPWFFPSKEEA